MNKNAELFLVEIAGISVTIRQILKLELFRVASLQNVCIESCDSFIRQALARSLRQQRPAGEGKLQVVLVENTMFENGQYLLKTRQSSLICKSRREKPSFFQILAILTWWMSEIAGIAAEEKLCQYTAHSKHVNLGVVVAPGQAYLWR